MLLTQAIHTLDLFQSLTGPVTRVAAMAETSPLRSIDTEDIVAAAVGFANGAIGTIDATTVSYPGFPERVELACEKATAVLLAESLEVHWKDGRSVRDQGSLAGGVEPTRWRSRTGPTRRSSPTSSMRSTRSASRPSAGARPSAFRC